MIFDQYVKLTAEFPNACQHLYGHALTDDNSRWLSVDEFGFPSILFSVDASDLRNDIELRSISVHFSRKCKVQLENEEVESGVFTIVRLNESDPDIVRIFLRLVEEAFKDFERLYKNQEIATRILELSDLFRQISETSGDIIGLWGELHIISLAENLDVGVQCWCSHPRARYDFVATNFVLEVKTTVSTRRKHRFSLEQLRPTDSTRVYVASIVVLEANSGKTVSEVIDDIFERISDEDLRSRFFRQCLSKGGIDVYRDTMRLGLLPLGASLRVFDSSQIPVPRLDQGAAIDRVRFDVDLTEVPQLSRGEKKVVLSF